MTEQFSIAIHGGAGTIERSKMDSELEASIKSALQAAVKAGYDLLAKGESAVDAVVAAVKVLEDSPHFNAGKGSVLTHNEMVEMDASVMCGKQLEAGAVAGVRHIRNPVTLARDVMQKSDHVFLIGEGAESFAFEQGHVFTEQDYFFTDRRYEQLQTMKSQGRFALSEAKYPDDKKFGTVGAVALDQHGNLAAATSTGGITNKKYGRVGDSPVIGAGNYAKNNVVAVSATGMGEAFLRHCVSHDIAARMQYLQQPMAQACDTVIHGELLTHGGEGGLIAIDAEGDVHFAMNSSGMYRAKMTSSGQVEVKIFASE